MKRRTLIGISGVVLLVLAALVQRSSSLVVGHYLPLADTGAPATSDGVAYVLMMSAVLFGCTIVGLILILLAVFSRSDVETHVEHAQRSTEP